MHIGSRNPLVRHLMAGVQEIRDADLYARSVQCFCALEQRHAVQISSEPC
jgi:hypothetical protein